jgi:hypothetical protein
VVRGLDALGPSDLLPLLGTVEALTHILDFDVVDQRRQRRLSELLLNEGLAFLSVKDWFITLHILTNIRSLY